MSTTAPPSDRPLQATASLRHLARYFVPHLTLLALVLGCGLAVGLLQVSVTQLIKLTQEQVFAAGSATESSPPPGPLANKRELPGVAAAFNWLKVATGRPWVEVIPIAIALVYLLQGVSRFAQEYAMAVVGQRVIRRLRGELYGHFQALSLDYFSEHHTGVMLSRITNDVNVLDATVPSLNTLARDPAVVAALMASAFYLWWQMGLIIVGTLVLVVYPLRRFGARVRHHTLRGQERMGTLTSILKENFGGIRVIKAFGMERYEQARFDRENQRLYDANVRRAKSYQATNPSLELLMAFAIAGIVAYTGHQVAAGRVSGGLAFQFFAAVGLMMEPLKRISQMYPAFQSGLAASERIFLVLHSKPSVVDADGAPPLDPIRHELRFKNVHFRYQPDAAEVLCGLDLTVRAGETVAIVGTSGAGKTTLINLIPRFYDPSAGRITIDGTDIRTVTTASLRAQIALVTQETFLFDDTVKANIAYGQVEADFERIVEAAKRAYAHDFITSFPKGYDTPIGELGQRFSGGQRQRLAIARALFRNAPILLLDEATSNLDTESEREVQRALDNLMRGRTTIVIAHRLSTVQRADRIVVLAQGRLVEDGAHDELLARDGEYARLYRLQFAE
jgi:ATP-binding cassette, subfamily B, bacterial MsbA